MPYSSAGMPDMQDSTNQGKQFSALTFHVSSSWSTALVWRDQPNMSEMHESASRRVLPNKLASRFTLRIATQVEKQSDRGNLAQAWLCCVHVSICKHELLHTIYNTIYKHWLTYRGFRKACRNAYLHEKFLKGHVRWSILLSLPWLDWAALFPSTWFYQQYILTEPDLWFERHFYPSTIYSYSRPGHAAVWGQYFAARMLINSTRLRVLKVSPSNPLIDFTYGQQQLECITRLNAMADSLAFSIPFCLKNFKVADSPNSSIRQSSNTLNTNEAMKPYLASLALWPLSRTLKK